LADKAHPYAAGGTGGIAAAITQFRKSFPPNVTAETLRKLGIAPKNESYLINILRFIGLIDENGSKTAKATDVFSKHGDQDFQKAFEKIVKEAYSELFTLHSDSAWKIPTDDLISFFRATDQTSDLVGRRQAATFQALASFAGHGEAPAQSKASKPREPKAAPSSPRRKPNMSNAPIHNGGGDQNGNAGPRDVGLTVRIEVNLPSAADQETYDRIFRSIRENLLNAK
jgi:Family of unknown function (DUF5343)